MDEPKDTKIEEIKNPEGAAPDRRESLREIFDNLKQKMEESADKINAETEGDLKRILAELRELGIKESDLDLQKDMQEIEAIQREAAALKAEFEAKIETSSQSEKTVATSETAQEKSANNIEIRRKIISQVDEGLEILKNLPEAQKSDRIKWIIKSVEDAKNKAQDSADLTFEVKVDDRSQREGIPVDDLIEELKLIAQGQEAEAGKLAERKKDLESMARLAKDLKKQYEQTLEKIGHDKEGTDQEHQEKIAWHQVYNGLSPDKRTIRGRVRQWVDATRQTWAKADKEAGNSAALNQEGADYAADSDYFPLQTGEALRQVTEKATQDGEGEVDRDKLKKLNEELNKINGIIETLQANSKGYFEIRPDMKGDEQHWRTELEAVLASLDMRSTGDADKDYQLAMEAMSKRREIVLQEDKKPEEKPKIKPLEITYDEPLQIEHKPESAGELEVVRKEKVIIEPTVEPLQIEHKPESAGELEVIKKSRENIFIVDISEIVKAMAWREAEQKLRGMLDKTQSNFLTRAAVRLGEKGYLMKYYKEALAAIKDNKNLMAEIEARMLTSGIKSENIDKSYEVLDAVLEEFTHEVMDADEKGDLVQDDEINLAVGQLFADYATSDMTRAEFDQTVEVRVIALLKNKNKKFGATGREDEAEGLMYANNLFALAEGYRKQVEGQVKELGKEFGPEQTANIELQIKAEMALDIQLGLKQKDLYETKPKPVLKWYEKFVDATENIPILNKVVANPVTYGIVGGIAGSLASKSVTRAVAGIGLVSLAGVAPWLTPLLIGAGMGGTFTAMRRSRDLQYDRGMDLRRSTLGIEVDDDAKRTNKIREFNYDLKRAEQLQASLAEIMARENLTDEDKKAIADVMARIELEKEKSVDLIGVSEAEGKAHKTKQIAMKDLKVALKDIREKFNLSPDGPEMQALINEIKADLTGNIEQNDNNFEAYKRWERKKSFLIGAGTGLAAGAIGQWITGQFSEHVLGRTPKAESALEHIYHWFRGDHGTAGEGAVQHLTFKDGQLLDSQGHIMVKSPIELDPKTGRIDPELLKSLKESRIIPNEIHTQVTENVSVASKLQEGLAKHARADWHDEPGKKISSFFNRLIEHEGKQQMFYLNKDASGNVVVDASKILENLSANAKDAVKEFGTNPDGSVDTKLAGLRDQLAEWASKGELAKHLKVAIFPTEGDNKAGLSYLTDSADGSGKINLGDAISKLFGAKDSMQDGNIPFRFGELRIIDDAGNSHVLATISGKNIDAGVMSGTVTDKFSYSFDMKNPEPPIGKDWEVPPILPFDPRRPLEGPRKKDKELEAVGTNNPEGGAGETGGRVALEDLRRKNNVPENLPVVDKEIPGVTFQEGEKSVTETKPETTVEEPKIETSETEVKRQTLEDLIKEIPLDKGKLKYNQKKKTREWLSGLTTEEIDEIRFDPKKTEQLKKLVEASYFEDDRRTFQNGAAETAFEGLKKRFTAINTKDIFEVPPAEQPANSNEPAIDVTHTVIR